MYNWLRGLGIILYPGAVTSAKTFRIGVIGDIDLEDVRRVLSEMSNYLKAKNIDLNAHPLIKINPP